MTVTEVLNIWNEMGVFSYVIPFLLMFAVVFAILQKTKILGDNKTIEAIIAAAIGLLALQFDFVSEFFAVIFPRFGIGLAIFLVLIILLGFFITGENGDAKSMQWIGWVVGLGVAIWAITDWNTWFGGSGYGWGGFSVGFWLSEYFWPLIILAAVIGVIVWTVKSGSSGSSSGGSGP